MTDPAITSNFLSGAGFDYFRLALVHIIYSEPHIRSMKLPTLTCKRCGYKWHPRTEGLPATCPNRKCKSPYWNRGGYTKSSLSRAKRPMGKPKTKICKECGQSKRLKAFRAGRDVCKDCAGLAKHPAQGIKPTRKLPPVFSEPYEWGPYFCHLDDHKRTHKRKVTQLPQVSLGGTKMANLKP